MKNYHNVINDSKKLQFQKSHFDFESLNISNKIKLYSKKVNSLKYREIPNYEELKNIFKTEFSTFEWNFGKKRKNKSLYGLDNNDGKSTCPGLYNGLENISCTDQQEEEQKKKKKKKKQHWERI